MQIPNGDMAIVDAEIVARGRRRLSRIPYRHWKTKKLLFPAKTHVMGVMGQADVGQSTVLPARSNCPTPPLHRSSSTEGSSNISEEKERGSTTTKIRGAVAHGEGKGSGQERYPYHGKLKPSTKQRFIYWFQQRVVEQCGINPIVHLDRLRTRKWTTAMWDEAYEVMETMIVTWLDFRKEKKETGLKNLALYPYIHWTHGKMWPQFQAWHHDHKEAVAQQAKDPMSWD